VGPGRNKTGLGEAGFELKAAVCFTPLCFCDSTQELAQRGLKVSQRCYQSTSSLSWFCAAVSDRAQRQAAGDDKRCAKQR